MYARKQRITVRYDGYVQGVCFRMTVVELARPFNVTGFVRNCSDGSVEIVVEGYEDEIMGLVNAIRLSHLSRGISGEQLHRSPATGEFKIFKIRY